MVFRKIKFTNTKKRDPSQHIQCLFPNSFFAAFYNDREQADTCQHHRAADTRRATSICSFAPLHYPFQVLSLPEHSNSRLHLLCCIP